MSITRAQAMAPGAVVLLAPTVIARFASHPLAGNVNLDPTSLPAYRAIADHLMARTR